MCYVGIIGYGGGPSIIAFLKDIFVNRKAWMTEEDFLTGVSLSQLLPGANAMATVVYIGYRMQGSLGAAIAPVAFIFPSTVLMIALSALYFLYGSLHIVLVLFTGLGAVVIGLLVNAVIVMGRSAIKNIWAALIALAVLLTMLCWKDAQILLIVPACALLGLLIFRNPREDASAAAAPPAETVPTPPWFWWSTLVVLLAVVLLFVLTAQSPVTRMFLALLRVGVFTFGGGYASVPLFQQVAVSQYHWLTLQQFRDGIALGQVTPGPVLITSSFIGYRVLGILGGVLGTIAVFMPGALAMFFVAHQSERFVHLRWLQAMVRGIVAGFIGVILAVTIHLGQQSITDWKTLILAIASAFVLTVLKRDPIWVILGGAVLSMLLFY